MSNFDAGNIMSGMKDKIGSRTGAAGAPTELGGGATGTMASQQGLPPTGLQQQMQSLNSMYESVQGAGSGVGFDPRQQQFQQANIGPGGGSPELESTAPMGSTSIDQLARNLAQRYGLPIGRGRLVDDQGNFLYTPQQLADASGGAMTLGEAAASMNMVAQGVYKNQRQEGMDKGIAALETGLGQVQSRGRGSLAGMMSGYYQDIAGMYANQEFEMGDFSYWIQKEQLQIQQDLMRRQEKMAKRQARYGAIAGIGLGVAGLFTGNVGLAVGGFSQAAGGAAGAGWF